MTLEIMQQALTCGINFLWSEVIEKDFEKLYFVLQMQFEGSRHRGLSCVTVF